ncbi:MAG: BRO family protein [Verrucomicrobiota bacterium]|jgi:prophage antirepressor-like protein
MQLALQVFEDEKHHKIRTVTIDGEAWFYALDICEALDIKNSRDALGRLDDDEKRTVGSADSSVVASRTNPQIISESGLYNLVFQSRKEEARRFRKWVTSEVLPRIRKTGSFGMVSIKTPKFVRRFNDNWDRTERGYFSIISELYIRFAGRLEQVGHILADNAPDGKEIRPDVSVGKTFPAWLKKNYPLKANYYKMYSHKLPDGMLVDARQYRNDMLEIFIEFIDVEWLPNHAPAYLESRDRKALSYLPKLLPPAKG